MKVGRAPSARYRSISRRPRSAVRGSPRIQLRVEQVDRADVERRRDAHARAAVDEAVRRSRASPRRGRGTSRRAPAVTSISRSAPVDLGRSHHEAHGEAAPSPARAVEQRPVAGLQRQAQPRASSASMPRDLLHPRHVPAAGELALEEGPHAGPRDLGADDPRADARARSRRCARGRAARSPGRSPPRSGCRGPCWRRSPRRCRSRRARSRARSRRAPRPAPPARSKSG